MADICLRVINLVKMGPEGEARCKALPHTCNDFVNDIVNDARADAIFATVRLSKDCYCILRIIYLLHVFIILILHKCADE